MRKTPKRGHHLPAELSSKSESRNPKQIPKQKSQCSKRVLSITVLVILLFDIPICLGFRISCFGFPQHTTQETVEPCQFSPAELVDYLGFKHGRHSDTIRRPPKASVIHRLLDVGTWRTLTVIPSDVTRVITAASPIAGLVSSPNHLASPEDRS
jgi:hypothetical protein